MQSVSFKHEEMEDANGGRAESVYGCIHGDNCAGCLQGNQNIGRDCLGISTQISDWKKRSLDGSAEIFSGGKRSSGMQIPVIGLRFLPICGKSKRREWIWR
jgi:hypothetical protein